MKNILSIVVILLTINISYAKNLIPSDSLRSENKNGTVFIIHKVDNGQTLYSLLKKYNCTSQDFYVANPKLAGKSEIQKGQLLKFPSKARKVAAPVVVPKKEDDGITIVDVPEATPKEYRKVQKDDSGIEVIDVLPNIKKDDSRQKHIVAAGETLFQISHKYGLNIEYLKQINKLIGNTVLAGQELIVEKPTNAAIKVKKDSTKVKQGPAGSPENEKASIPTSPVLTPKKATVIVPNAPTGKKVSELGIAEIIDAGEQTNKYLALHRNAPIGSLVRVKNEANNASVWVKVIGHLPEAGNQDILIKISPKAFEKLLPKDRTIRAEVSYTVIQ